MDADDPDVFEPNAKQEEAACKLVCDYGPWRKDTQPTGLARLSLGLHLDNKGDRAEVREG